MPAADKQGRTGTFGGIGEPLKVRPRAYGMTIRSTALPDGLLRDHVLRAVRYCESYIDLLGPSAPARLSLAQRAVRIPVVAAVYQRVWRPTVIAAVRAGVPFFAGPRAAVDQLVAALL